MKRVIALVLCFALVLSISFSSSAFSTVAVKSIKLDTAKIYLKVGESYQLKAAFIPANTSQTRLKYVTSNQKIASIDTTGKIKAVGEGTVEITAISASNSNVVSKCKITVDPKVPKKFAKLSWYFFGGGPQAAQEKVEAEINKYLKEKINASVTFYNYDWDTYAQRMPLMAASGEPFDIMYQAQWLSVNTFIAKNYLLDLNKNDMLQRYAPDVPKILDADFMEEGRVNGIQYTLPVNKEKGNSYGLWFRKDLVDKYKFDLNSIKKIEDLEPWFKILKEKEPSVIPWAPSSGEGTFVPERFEKVVPGVEAAVVRNSGKDFKIVNRYETPDYMKAFKLAYDWRKKGYIENDALAKKNSQAERGGKGAYFVSMNALTPGKDAQSSTDTLKFVQKELTPVYFDPYTERASGHTISVTSKNPERALMLINMMYTDKKLYNMVVYGVEGLTYNKVSDNYINKIQDSGWGMWDWSFGNIFLEYLPVGSPADKWEQYKQFNKTAIKFRTSGFECSQDIISAFDGEITAIKNVTAEYGDSLAFGVSDPATTIPEMSKKMKAAGYDKLIAAVQRDLDAWARNKK